MFDARCDDSMLRAPAVDATELCNRAPAADATATALADSI
jgi:hypothetical protein